LLVSIFLKLSLIIKINRGYGGLIKVFIHYQPGKIYTDIKKINIETFE